jgi:hypothetical protein
VRGCLCLYLREFVPGILRKGSLENTIESIWMTPDTTPMDMVILDGGERRQEGTVSSRARSSKFNEGSIVGWGKGEQLQIGPER